MYRGFYRKESPFLLLHRQHFFFFFNLLIARTILKLKVFRTPGIAYFNISDSVETGNTIIRLMTVFHNRTLYGNWSINVKTDGQYYRERTDENRPRWLSTRKERADQEVQAYSERVVSVLRWNVSSARNLPRFFAYYSSVAVDSHMIITTWSALKNTRRESVVRGRGDTTTVAAGQRQPSRRPGHRRTKGRD